VFNFVVSGKNRFSPELLNEFISSKVPKNFANNNFSKDNSANWNFRGYIFYLSEKELVFSLLVIVY